MDYPCDGVPLHHEDVPSDDDPAMRSNQSMNKTQPFNQLRQLDCIAEVLDQVRIGSDEEEDGYAVFKMTHNTYQSLCSGEQLPLEEPEENPKCTVKMFLRRSTIPERPPTAMTELDEEFQELTCGASGMSDRDDSDAEESTIDMDMSFFNEDVWEHLLSDCSDDDEEENGDEEAINADDVQEQSLLQNGSKDDMDGNDVNASVDPEFLRTFIYADENTPSSSLDHISFWNLTDVQPVQRANRANISYQPFDQLRQMDPIAEILTEPRGLEEEDDYVVVKMSHEAYRTVCSGGELTSLFPEENPKCTVKMFLRRSPPSLSIEDLLERFCYLGYDISDENDEVPVEMDANLVASSVSVTEGMQVNEDQDPESWDESEGKLMQTLRKRRFDMCFLGLMASVLLQFVHLMNMLSYQYCQGAVVDGSLRQ